jgi:hypothetical protein
MTRPWAAGAATGVGSLPGVDPVEAARLVFGELPGLPHLPELPGRGPGAEVIGRSGGLLVDLPVEIVPSGWRLASRPGRDLQRAREFLLRDLDALEKVADGYTGALKLQIVGPWTLASNVELASGHKVVSDYGAARDLAESLAEGLRVHLADVATRVPGAALVVQVDEPGLNAVLAGQVLTPSGYGTVRAVDPHVVEQALRTVLDVAPRGARVVHCCADDAPIELLRAAGADAVSVDLSVVGVGQYDELGAAVEAGVSLWLGVVPSTDAVITQDAARERVRALWNALGFAPSQLAASVVPTPACGLSGATDAYVRRALAVLRDTGKSLLDEG